MSARVSKKSQKSQSNKSDKAFTLLLAQVQQAEAFAKKNVKGELLTPEEKKTEAKLPTTALATVPVIASLWTKYGAASADGPAGTMLQDLAYAQRVRETAVAAESLSKTLLNEAFVAETSVWADATQAYGLLRMWARKNKELRLALQPVRAFFRRGVPALERNKAAKADAAKAAAAPAAPAKAG